MTIFLPHPELERLAKLCGLFSSHHDGERASAAAKADEIVRGLGLTWRDIVLSENTPQAPAANSIEEQIAQILRSIAVLNDWERKFVADIKGQSTFSPKQRSKIEQVYRKVCSHYARGAR